MNTVKTQGFLFWEVKQRIDESKLKTLRYDKVQ